MKHYLKIFLAVILGTSAIVAIGQENDDLYFTKKDRVKQKKKFNDVANQYRQKNTPEVQKSTENDENLSFLGRSFKESNPVIDDEGFVSDESLEYYKPEKTQADYQVDRDYASYGQDQNPNFSNPQETFIDNVPPQQVIVNNYYNDNWNTWNRPRLRFGLGWNNWGGNFWSVSYGNAWGNPWYDPFWDPWYNNWGPGWGWNAGWGWNSWAANPWGWGVGFNSFWCPPVYGNFYGRPVYVVDSGQRRGRNVVRGGGRTSRGSVSTRGSRSSSGRTASVSRESRNSRANYSRQQADYLNRSRSSRYNATNSRGSNSVNTRSTNSSNSSRFTSGNRSNSNRNVSRSSNTSRNRSYSPPASRSSRGSSMRSSGSSRSRSSGSVGRSRSSSSRSSGSRSSSGRSSSSRRGRN